MPVVRITVFLAALLLVACSAGGTPPPPGDGGGGGGMDAGPDFDGGVRPGFDAGPPNDGGPPFDPDAACDMTTPLGTEIIGDPPDMMLVVDISGSMCSPLIDSFPPSMTTKMQIMRDALHGLVDRMDRRINFGMMFFPSDDMCAAGTVRNPIMPMNASAIQSTLGTLTVDFFGCALAHPGATPTGPTLDAARAHYGTIPMNPIGRYVLLATDGLPNCGPPLPEGGTEETVDETITAISALFSLGIQTYVLGLGDGFGGTGDLDRMAAAGGTTRHYSARSPTELDTALSTIAATVIPPSCTVAIDGPPRNPDLFRVRFDGGDLIPRDMSHTRGWDYDPATNTITFYGAECAAVESGSVTSVDVDFGCPGPLI